MKDLKRKALHGGLARFCGQAASFVIRLTSVVVLARLLSPEEFGLAAMAIIVTGVYELFSASLSSATIQKDNVSDEQASTLFWINIAIGLVLGLLCFATAPLLVAFYHEPRLFWATGALGIGFLFSAAGVQHSGLLARQLRYPTLAVIDTVALLVSVIVSIGLAMTGVGFWALVAGAIVTPAVGSSGMWLASRWIPGAPRRVPGIGSLLLFGGTMTLNGVVIYIAYNIEKVLLGRFWGAEALGVYGRAYQLINFPTSIINASVGSVAFATLSRLQNDPRTYKRYFLKGYTLVNSVTMPTTPGQYEFRFYPNNGFVRTATSPAVTVATMNPTPSITSLSPSSVVAGGTAFSLTVTGSGFVSGATATVGGQARAVLVGSTTQLTIAVSAADVARQGSVAVQVTNPSPCVGGLCASSTSALSQSFATYAWPIVLSI
jgi:hypothetical protein